jgi:hypothetical protein
MVQARPQHSLAASFPTGRPLQLLAEAGRLEPARLGPPFVGPPVLFKRRTEKEEEARVRMTCGTRVDLILPHFYRICVHV